MHYVVYFFLAFFAVAVGIAIVCHFHGHRLDRSRLQAYFEERGGTLVSAELAGRTTRVVGENQSRLYEVRYFDCDGNEHFAYVKTGLWMGVYFTEDRIVEYAKPPVEPEELEWLRAENARLRAELDRLKSDRISDAIQE